MEFLKIDFSKGNNFYKKWNLQKHGPFSKSRTLQNMELVKSGTLTKVEFLKSEILAKVDLFKSGTHANMVLFPKVEPTQI